MASKLQALIERTVRVERLAVLDCEQSATLEEVTGAATVLGEWALDLASGEITDVRYHDHDLESGGFPAEREDYDFTCGILRNGSKEVEFRIEVDVVGRKYSITPSELLELKGRAAKL